MKLKLEILAGAIFVATTATVLVALNYKINAVSATQDNILRTLSDEGIIQGLRIGK